MKIVIVDYGMGNIRSISSTLKYLGIEEVILSSDYEVLKGADKIVLPGVGSFAKAMYQIKEKKLDLFLQEFAVDEKKPLLGICLGMQLLGLSSTEDGSTPGLAFVNGTITKFDDAKLKVPHVGFNQVKASPASRLYCEIPQNPDFYFTHSYRMLSNDDINQSLCDYEGEFVASFECENIAGVQFHPELSQNNGLKLLRNFIEKF
jgi:glutamine amidotransferase